MDHPLTTRRLVLLVLAAAVAGSMVARVVARESGPRLMGHAVALQADGLHPRGDAPQALRAAR